MSIDVMLVEGAPVDGDDQVDRPGQVHFLGVDFDLVDEEAMLARLIARDWGDRFEYVVTPNSDHIVQLNPRQDGQYTAAYRAAYAGAALRLCDSRVLQFLARLKGVALPLCPGSDLTARLFKEVLRAGDKIAIIGGDAALLADLRARYPAPDYVQHCPPMGLLGKDDAISAIINFVAHARPDFILLAVGSPQSEIVAHQMSRAEGVRGLALCIGASIEFLTDRKARAPGWMRAAGIEWLHRLLSEPRRLWRRYLVKGPRVFWLVLHDHPSIRHG